MKLNESDYKLLSYLYHHNREPITKIAKACKLSREQVDYKIKKYLSSGLIRGFVTFFDYRKFGYNYLAALMLKFEKPSSIKQFTEKLKKSKNCMSYGKVFGKYDLFINYIFKNEKEISDHIADLISNSEYQVSDYFIIKPYLSELYPLKFFKHKDRENYTYSSEILKERKFDKKEIAIVKVLAKDARTKLIEISKKVNISIELAHYKIKKLQKDKVLLGSRIQFDMSKFGYYFSLIFLNVRNFSKANQEKIKQFSRTSKHVTSFNLMLTRPNCILNLFHKEESELREIIDEIKELFKNESTDIEIILIGEDETEINSLPFL